MSILTEVLPHTVEVSGITYEINTDYRVYLRLSSAVESPTEIDMVTLLNLLQSVYPVVPDDIEAAFNQIFWFYRRGADDTQKQDDAPVQNNAQGYSFEQDAGYIYAAFLQAYQIDLTHTDMHWWLFLSLFESLPEDTKIEKIMQIRTIKITSKMSKNEREYYKTMKNVYALKGSNDHRLTYAEYKQKMLDYVNRRMRGGQQNG